ncbi:GNAT family N-acetyltransferase [Streptomyces cyaneus]|uniref:GNAT family N-acetyltransferase n=1 Tax=Streptomyces cyaneus TaxID=1904 RepID=UPI000FF8A5FE|nr:GNAT family N-acetyltransferase [Streptomyces cyaneus]
MSITVSTGVPHHWEQRYPGATVFAGRRWIDLGSVWYPGELLTLEAVDAQLAITGAVVETPLSAARRCPWSIASGAMSGQGFAADGPHPWAGLQAQEVSPVLFLMFPYYLGDIVGGDARRPEALDVFLADCEGWARAQGCRSVAFMYGTDIPEQAAALARAGYARVPVTQRGELRVTWSDWEGYLAGFASRRRQRLRKDREAIAAAGVLLAEEPLPDDTAQLVELRCNLLRKYGALHSVADEQAMVDRVAALRPRDSLTMMTARHGGRLVSYTVFVRDGVQWTPILAGSDYSDESSNCYFGTTFYLPVSLAAGRGVEVIDYGAGAIATKRLRGCAVTDLVAHVRGLG